MYTSKIYYHGSNSKFNTFDKSKIKQNKLGLCFNFTDDYSLAYQYGDNILKVHLDLNNPITREIMDSKWTYEQDEALAKKLGLPPQSKEEWKDANEKFYEIYDIFKMKPEFIKLLEEWGYDGIVYPEEHHFGVFEPEQIHVIQNEDFNDNFYKWFGNSKMVNKDGTPKIFYHVTSSDFNEFKPVIWDKKQGFVPDEEKGRHQYYFTQHKDWADNFGKKEFSRKNRKNQRILQVYLRVENPLVIYNVKPQELEWWKSYFEKKNIHFTIEELEEISRYGANHAREHGVPQVSWEVIFNDTNLVQKRLKEAGYDGIIIGDTKRADKYSSSVIVFNSNQIKSIGNNGNWSSSNNIYEQLAYHGTNAEFDKFDLNKFQRGDYGYGIYFTRDKKYASDYGNIKQYEIPDDEYLLSWEDTWHYQSEYVYNCLDKLFDDLYDNNRDAWEKIMEIVDRGYGNDGEGLYYNLSETLKLSSKQTSELLYKYGIKGIDSFKGNCQVIFNPEDIKILVTENFKFLNKKLQKYVD